MAKAPPISFWFTMGSTYTYLTVMRLGEVEKATGLTFRWRPFHLLTILQGMKHVPFADKPAKMAYMWRDIARRAEMYGIPVCVPAPYPAKQSIVANKIAFIGCAESWGPDFIRAAYRRWFQLGEETGSEPNVSSSLREIGQDPERVLARAASEEIGRRLEDETTAARELGIFGSPTFSIGTELFWGDDRLEDAIRWHRRNRDRHD
ncbi:MAG TPA: DsbA family protein [Stellaceae bacterium]|nr:DsbA family protein [Stellaceae bacterium]